MASADVRRKLVAVAVFALPILLAKGTGVVMGPAKASAGPSSGDSDVEHVQVVTVEDFTPDWSDEQLAAAEYADRMQVQPFGNPMFYPAERPDQIIEIPVTPDEILMTASVTAVMNTRNGAIALVDGKPRRVGDKVMNDAWVITDINHVERSVTFKHLESGREIKKVVSVG